MITGDENKYIRNIVKAICKTNSFCAAIYGSYLYIIVDKTQLYIVNLEGKLADNVQMMGFENNSLENPEYILDSDCLGFVLKKANEYISRVNNGNIIYSCNDLKADPLFNEILHLKSAEGAKLYFIDNISSIPPLVSFASLFNLNKDDRISADIFLENGIALYYFHIYKKKINLNYDMIMRSLDLNMSII